MSLDLWQQTKEQVREAIDIVDLVGSYVPLRRQGQEFLGRCPWHDDSRPSLHVNPQRQSFRCFVCDVGGDLFSFLMRIEGVEFREALEMLADRAGIRVAPTPTPGRAPETGSPNDKKTLYGAMAWADEQYHRCLLEADEAEPARRYLAERQINDASIARFRLGFAPNSWDWLLGRGAAAGFSGSVLQEVGLAVPRSGGEGHYDRFRGRVLFPIYDANRRPDQAIALGGRILPQFAEQDAAKYINSPETPLFSKNRQVYGMNLARDAIQKEKNIIVVEGYTDCVIAHQCGVQNVVAVLGTALGVQHIGLLRRFADQIILVLDGDEAGQRRANQILELFVAAQVDLRILTLPRDLDPCDFLLSQGSDAFGRLLAEADDALQHKIRAVTQGLDIATDTHRANEALEEVLGTLARAPRLSATTPTAVRLREQQILSRLSRTFAAPEETMRRRLAELRRKAPREAVGPAAVETASALSIRHLDPWDVELLELVLLMPEQMDQLAASIAVEDLRSPPARSLYSKCLELQRASSAPTFDRLMLEFDDPNLKSLLVLLEQQSRAKQTGEPPQRLADVLTSFRQRKEDEQHRTVDDEDRLDELFAVLKPRHRRSAPTEG